MISLELRKEFAPWSGSYLPTDLVGDTRESTIVPRLTYTAGWIDPVQEASIATILLLVDGALVLLRPYQPTATSPFQYDRRVIKENVEYFFLSRHLMGSASIRLLGTPISPSLEDLSTDTMEADLSLRDSIWTFDGTSIHLWTNLFQLLLPSDSVDPQASAISVPTQSYPLAIDTHGGLLLGLDSDSTLCGSPLVSFSPELKVCSTTSQLHTSWLWEGAFCRYVRADSMMLLQSSIFLQYVLLRLLSPAEISVATRLSRQYEHLDYFPHILELLLHQVLDEHVEHLPEQDEELLPAVLAFISLFSCHLDVIVRCTRKTDLSAWRPLFQYLPSPNSLFHESLRTGRLITASGFLLILHTLLPDQEIGPELQELLRCTVAQQMWGLAKEIARFLKAVEEGGDNLGVAMRALAHPARLYSPASPP